MFEDNTHLATENYQIVEGRYGRFLVNICDYYMGQSMIRYGEYSPDEVKAMTTLTPQGGTVIEVGANIGLITVPLAHKVGLTGRVLAYEPIRCNYFALCATLALNDLVNVIPARVAVGRDFGSAKVPVVNQRVIRDLYENGEIVNLGSISLDKNSDNPVFDTVSLISLDNLDLERLDLVKIGVGGMELEILQGGKKNISKYRPFMFVENNLPDKSPELIRFINALGYKCFWYTSSLYSPDNYKGNKENIFGNVVNPFNMICAPEDKVDFVQGLQEAHAFGEHPLKRKK